MRETVIPVVVGALGTFPKSLEKILKEVGNQKKNRSNLDQSIVKIKQNTEKSPGDVRKFVVTQTPVKVHQLKLGWKTRKKQNNHN